MIKGASAALNMPKLMTESMQLRRMELPEIQNKLLDLKLLVVGSYRNTLEKALFNHPEVKTLMRMLAFEGDINPKMECGAKFLGKPSEYRPLLEIWRRVEKEPEPWYIFVSSDKVEVVKGIIGRQIKPSRKKRAPYVRNEFFVTEFMQ